MNEDTRPLWLRFLIPTAVGLIIALLYAVFAAQVFQQTETREVLRGISDSFLLPGVILFAVGGLSWVASKGFFDLPGYAVHSLFGFFIPDREDSDRASSHSFYEYKQKKDQKGRHWLPFVLLSGVFFLLLSILFAILYH